MKEPTIAGWSITTILAVAGMCGAVLIYAEGIVRDDQADHDRLANVEIRIGHSERQIGAHDVQLLNIDLTEGYNFVVLTEIAQKLGIRDLPQRPYLHQVPNVSADPFLQPYRGRPVACTEDGSVVVENERGTHLEAAR